MRISLDVADGDLKRKVERAIVAAIDRHGWRYVQSNDRSLFCGIMVSVDRASTTAHEMATALRTGFLSPPTAWP